MANQAYGKYVLGLRNVVVTKLDGSAQEPLDAIQEFNVTITVEEAVLEGNDVEISSVSLFKDSEGSAGAGSLSMAAMAIIFGTSVATTGSTPNRVSTVKINTSLRPPYFKIYGEAFDDQLGALHVLVPKAKLSGDFEIPLQQGTEWLTPGFDFRCLADANGDIVELRALETRVALPTT